LPNISVLAHGDVCSQNVIVETGSSLKLHLIDWENFGYWDPAAEIATIFEAFGFRFAPNQEKLFLTNYEENRKDQTLLSRLEAFRPLVILEQLIWSIRHVYEIIEGDMNEAFVTRTEMSEHLLFVDSCLTRCKEAGLLDVGNNNLQALEIFPDAVWKR
jgi:thiamine kinase-like enzyme